MLFAKGHVLPIRRPRRDLVSAPIIVLSRRPRSITKLCIKLYLPFRVSFVSYSNGLQLTAMASSLLASHLSQDPNHSKLHESLDEVS